jgi:hypothetical protein
MIKIFIGALLLYTAPCKIFAQKNNGEPKNLLRFNILGLADLFDQNLSFGFEHGFNSNWSAGTDAGWIFNTNTLDHIRGANGIIARPFLRYYPKSHNSFWEVELHYKYVSYKIEDWLGRIPENNIPAYQEFTTFNLHKNAAGLHLKWGIQSNLSRNQKLKFEFVSGLGVRFKWYKVRDGIYTTGRGIININNISTTQTSISPVFPISLRLVYIVM